MKYLFTIALVVLVAYISIGQQRANVWYFGNNLGIDFSSGKAEIIEDGAIYAEAGCSSICDLEGNLLFYTNGNKVWNKNHDLMLNGDSLNGSQLVNQNSVIVPKPLSDSMYYLFTINDYDSLRGFNYSVVNINKDNGRGKIVEKNISVSKNLLEKIAAIKHCNNEDYWIITHGYSNNFYVYSLSADGFNTDTVKSKIGTAPKADVGYLKVSPAGNKIVLPVNKDSILAEVFEFNNKTGKVFNPIKILAHQQNTYCYGIEFSPEGDFLYLNTGGKKYELFQYDVSVYDEKFINASAIKIASGNNYAMQLAPDKKIYIAKENRSSIGAIKYPSIKGEACEYVENAINFPNGNSLMGLPNFVQTWFYKADFSFKNTCFLDSTVFSFSQNQNYDSIFWNINTNKSSNNINNDPAHISYVFQDTGIYLVGLNAYHCGILEEVVKEVEIFPYPKLNLPADTSICKNCSLSLDAGPAFDSYLWNTGSDNRVLNVFNEGIYYVSVQKNGCLSTDTTYVSEVEPLITFPNAFTPNGDGLNDKFKPLNVENVKDFHLWIHDRRGLIVFDSKDPFAEWDGTFQSQACYSQTYVWNVVFSFIDDKGLVVEKSDRGLVSLIR